MAWVAADVTALESALADGKGARVIQFSDQRVEFHSMSEMLDLLSTMKRSVNASPAFRLAKTSKGT